VVVAALLRRPWAMVLVVDAVLLALASSLVAAVGPTAPEAGELTAPPPAAPAPPLPHPAYRAHPMDPAAFPTAADTGARGPLQTSGPITVDQPGALIENLDVTGEINVVAPDVTIRNVRLHGGSATWLLVVRSDTGTTALDGVSVEADAGAAVEHGIFQVGNGRLAVRRSRILGTQDGCACASGSITDSFVRLGRSQNGSHNDGIQSGGGSGLLIRHNTILNPNGQTSAIALFEEFGPQVNVTVEDNLLAGGGYTIYAGDGSRRPSAVRVVRNVFSRRFFSSGGAYGPATAWCATCPGAVWSGNIWEGTRDPVRP